MDYDGIEEWVENFFMQAEAGYMFSYEKEAFKCVMYTRKHCKHTVSTFYPSNQPQHYIEQCVEFAL